MAREVIADLDFGDEGVNRVLGQTTQGIGRLESQTVRTANVFTARMFNMRTAAMAFLGGFTVAGAILAIKNFMEFAAKGDPAFKSMAASSTVFRDSLAEAVRSLPGFHSGLQVIEKILLQMATAAKVLKFYITTTATRTDLFAEWKRALGEVRAEQAALLKEGKVFADMYRVHWADINQEGRSAWQTWNNFRDVVNDGANITEENIGEMVTSLDTLQERLALVSSAGALAGQMLAQAFLEGGVTLREALETVLKQVAISLFVKAGEYFALGLAALTPWGAATLGPAPLYFKAAAAFAAAGAAVGAFGIAVGGRGQATGASGRVGSAAAEAPSRPSQTISVVIEGNVDSDARVRDIVDAISRALKDGASGGNFNGQLARA